MALWKVCFDIKVGSWYSWNHSYYNAYRESWISEFLIFQVKVQLQALAKQEIAVGHQHNHAGMWDAFQTVVKRDGVLGLWRGVTAAGLRVTVGSSAQLPTFSLSKEKIVNSRVRNIYGYFIFAISLVVFKIGNWMFRPLRQDIRTWIVKVFKRLELVRFPRLQTFWPIVSSGQATNLSVVIRAWRLNCGEQRYQSYQTKGQKQSTVDDCNHAAGQPYTSNL